MRVLRGQLELTRRRGLYPSELTAGESDDKNESSVGTLGLPIPLGRAGTGEEMACAILYVRRPSRSPALMCSAC